MSKSKCGKNTRKPKSTLSNNELGSTLFISIPAVEPAIRNFITYQTLRFVESLVDSINPYMPPDEQLNYIGVDSV